MNIHRDCLPILKPLNLLLGLRLDTLLFALLAIKTAHPKLLTNFPTVCYSFCVLNSNSHAILE